MNNSVEILERIGGIRGRLSPKLRAIGDVILKNPDLVRNKNINEMALLCGVSDATLSRFVRSIGLSNYRNFQLLMERKDHSNAPSTPPRHLHEDISRDDTVEIIAAKIAQRSADVTRSCLTTLNMSDLERAAHMIRSTKVIYFFAAGLSLLAAESGFLRFSRIGKPAVFHRDHNTQLLTASSLHPDVLAIGISDSGRTYHTLNVLDLAKKSGASTIAITSFPFSPLARQCDVSLITPAGYASFEEALIYECMTSKFGQLVIIDALYALVAVQDFDSSASLIDKGNSIIRHSREEPAERLKS